MKNMLLVFCVMLFSISAYCQSDWSWVEVAPLPEKISNNAVVVASTGGSPDVFSFAGIDTSKVFSGISLKAFQYDGTQNSFSQIDSLPDNMGKIAAGASRVGDKIYIIGGYSVFANGNEVSSPKVHIYDPGTGSYLPDGMDIPVPIDDHVQDAWRDSLIYVVTGWSNNVNVNNVQIYNPATNQWMAGTPTPNNNDYKVFGGSGVIIGDTIFYAGGAANWNGSTFPLTDVLRIGIIQPDRPDSITWSAVQDSLALGYRMGASSFDNRPIWLGGSLNSYNYDGIAYDGSGGVAPTTRIVSYDPQTGGFREDTGVIPPVMDLRGVAKISDQEWIIAGGMTLGQEVSDRVYRIRYGDITSGIEDKVAVYDFRIYPTIISDHLIFVESFQSSGLLTLYDIRGNRMLQRQFLKGTNQIQLPAMHTGLYLVNLESANTSRTFKMMIVE